MSKYKVIIFDMDGVLWILRPIIIIGGKPF